MTKQQAWNHAFGHALGLVLGRAAIGPMAMSVPGIIAAGLGISIALPTQAADFTMPAQNSLQLAQAVPANVRSLSVTGDATASVPADQAALILSFDINYYGEPPADPDAVPEPPAVSQPSDLKAATDALIAVGIPASDISIVREYYSPQALRMTIRVNRPTQARLSTLIDAASNAALTDGKFMASTSGVAYAASNCRTAETVALRSAMADAQAQAIALAEVADAEVGNLLNVSSSYGWNYSGPFGDSVCPTNLDDALRNAGAYSLQPYDSSQPAEVSVSVSVSLTYEMEP